MSLGSIEPMFHLLALAGAIPALIAMFIVDRADAKRPEPRRTLRLAAFFGALSSIPALIVEAVFDHRGPDHGIGAALYAGFVVAALPEEAGKALVVRGFAWNRPEFDERTDGIVYGTRAGLGFALFENISYLLGAQTAGAFITLFLTRALLTVPMHALTGGLMGHYAAWRRFEGRGPGFLGGYAVAVFIHGGFDSCLLALPTFYAEKDSLLLSLAAVGALAFIVVGLIALRRAWRQALAADDAAADARRSMPIRASSPE